MIPIITLILLLYFPSNGLGTKVFKFKEGSTDNNTLSSATLVNASESPLPDHFVICSSHKQQQVDTINANNIYVLYEDSNFTKPWISIGFYYHVNALWANIRYLQNIWYRLGYATREAFLHWIHICVEVDSINAKIRTSINGGNVTTVSNVKGLTPVPKLYLRLGVVQQSGNIGQFQFYGYVANLNILSLQNKTQDINSLFPTIGNACELMLNESSFISSWEQTVWKLVGKAVQEVQLHKNDICTKSKVFNFRIPLRRDQHEAVEECRKYERHANISKPPSPDMNNVTDIDMEHIYGEHYKECELFWTTFTDKYTEGTFVDELTNETILNMHWGIGQPNGGSMQNYVGINTHYKSFIDTEWDWDECTSCEVQRSTLFTMRGSSKFSHLEESYFPTICKGYIGFIGNRILIWYSSSV